MFLGVAYIATLFVLCAAWDDEGRFECPEPLPYVKEDDLPEFEPTKYIAEPAAYKPFNVHFVIPLGTSMKMRETLEKANEWVNWRLSTTVKAPVLKEIRRARMWDPAAKECKPGRCMSTDVPGEYLMPCQPPGTTNPMDVVPEAGVHSIATGKIRLLHNFNNITLVVYVFAENVSDYVFKYCTERQSVIAFAVTCERDSDTGRPTHGRIGICGGPDRLQGEKAARTILHEVLHILTFGNLVGCGSPVLGCPRNSSKKTSVMQCENVTYKRRTQNWMLANGTNSVQTRLLVTTPNVKKAAQEYYGCATVEGAAVQPDVITSQQSADENGKIPVGTMLPSAHWHPILLSDEVLMPFDHYASKLSTITLGLLQDIGWYEVDMDKAEPMGPPSGCIVTEESCREIILQSREMQKRTRKRNPAATLPNMGPYCDTEYSDADRVFTPMCFNNVEPLACKRLFDAFGCGIVYRPTYYDSLSCTDTAILPQFYLPEIGATVGPGTTCLSVGPMTFKKRNITAAFGICVEYRCKEELDTVNFVLKPFGKGLCHVSCRANESNHLIRVNFEGNEHCKKHLGESFQVICPTYDAICGPLPAADPRQDVAVPADTTGLGNKAPMMKLGAVALIPAIVAAADILAW